MAVQAVEAYRLAWDEAKRLGDFDEAILRRHLEVVTDWPEETDDDNQGNPSSLEMAQELFLDAWRANVPPRRLPRYLRRAVRRVLFGFVRELWAAVRSGWIPLWMHPPSGVNVYEAGDEFDDDDDSYAVIGFDVALGNDWNRDLLARAVSARPKDTGDDEDDEPCHDIPVWLTATDAPPTLNVMIGKERLVSASSEVIWNFLLKISEEYDGIEGDLSVYDPADDSRHELDVSMLPHELPQEYTKDFFDGE